MRVEPSGTHSPIAQPTTQPAARPAGKPAEATASTPDTGSFAPTDQLAQLLDIVRMSPAERYEAIQKATAKVASGELNTSEAAADTAKAIIASGDATAS